MDLRWIESKRVVGINEVESTSQEMSVGVHCCPEDHQKMDSDFSGLFSLAGRLELEIRGFPANWRAVP